MGNFLNIIYRYKLKALKNTFKKYIITAHLLYDIAKYNNNNNNKTCITNMKT